MRIYYRVEYYYYQYNSGLGDNGNKTDSEIVKTLEEARQLTGKIISFTYKNEDQPIEDDYYKDFCRALMAYDGFFVRTPKIFKVTEELIDGAAN
jgi:hypothetical protein